MTGTQQKLRYTQIILEQAKESSNNNPIFLANLDAFITDASSVTFVMYSEFSS